MNRTFWAALLPLVALLIVGGVWYGGVPEYAPENVAVPDEEHLFENFDDTTDYRDAPQGDESLMGEPRATYERTPSGLVLMSGTASTTDALVWGEAAAILPERVEQQFEHIAFYDLPSDDTLAFVDDEDGNGAWRFGINTAQHLASDERERALTVIHEATHVLTLGSEQSSPSGCGGYETDEGCYAPASYLGAFNQQFWSEPAEYSPQQFVTEYAAESVEEDIAESFAYYVVRPLAKGTSTVDAKLSFFERYTELAALRAEMRMLLKKQLAE